MRMTINCDMGEGFGLYRLGDDAAMMPHIDLANVACGFHASDPTTMRQTVRLAKKYAVKVGAHPSLPDLQGFGRRAMVISPTEVTDLVTYQVGALKAFLDAEDILLNHVKPHGALYGMAARDEKIAAAIADAVLHSGSQYSEWHLRHTKLLTGTRASNLSRNFMLTLNTMGTAI